MNGYECVCSNSSWLLLTILKVDHHQSIFLIETKNEYAVKMIILVVKFFVVTNSGNLSHGGVKNLSGVQFSEN